MDLMTLFDDAEKFKVCNLCLISKPLSSFRFEPRVRTRTTARCGDCLKIGNAAYAKAHPDRVAASRQKHNLKNAHRWTEQRQQANARKREARVEKRILAGLPVLLPRITEEGRRCSLCRRRKPLLDFPPDCTRGDGLNSYCRDCSNRRARERSKQPKIVEYRRRYMRALGLKKYGLTQDQFDAILKSQNHKCAICEDKLKDGTGGAAVDHNHKTNEIRGILCRLCNVGIGHFRENPWLMLQAIQYLQRTKGKPDVEAI